MQNAEKQKNSQNLDFSRRLWYAERRKTAPCGQKGNAMLEEVTKLLAQQLKQDPSAISPGASIRDDLGADSVDILMLLMTLEEEKGIVLSEEELAGIVRVEDIVSTLAAHGIV